VNPEHLYVHVPFCVRRCSYCDFAVTATSAPPSREWLEAIGRELAQRCAAEAWTLPLRLATVYVGGGTPSMLDPNAMRRLREVIGHFAVLAADAEWTVEANPESFSAPLARAWRAAGVNRLSLGVQSFHEPSLRWMGRLHGADGPARAVAAARQAGLDNISVDLIFGLPSRLGRDWAADLDGAVDLVPDHVSLYGLTAEAGTPLGRWVGAGRESLADEDTYAAEYRLAAERLKDAGYRHYEVSNFARRGQESRHNQAYWRRAAYVGLGPGAHSFAPPVRSWNVRDWMEYRSRLEAGDPVEGGREVLGEAESGLEAIWLGLRSTDGLDGSSLSPAQRVRVGAWQGRGWAEERGGRVTLTRDGWLLLDRLAVELDAGRG
jgi:oxygen-independent coproporphyrinogen III oxidase